MPSESQVGPIYSVPLIRDLPLGSGSMLQAMPDRDDLIRAIATGNDRVVAGYEVLLSHYKNVKDQLEKIQRAHR